VIPICAGLVNLENVSVAISRMKSVLTVKLSLKDEPGGTSHWVTPTGPSMSLVPFWNIPWKCMLVDSLPSYDVLVVA